eukprot:scaffold526190_cov46-Prasinocladus_malaysianus.AAC.1
MTDISQGLSDLDDTEDAIERKEQLLEELIDICESIDFAKGEATYSSAKVCTSINTYWWLSFGLDTELGKVGGLQCAIALVRGPHEGLRWRAAELLAICAQNNAPVQKEFSEAGVLDAGIPLLFEPSTMLK